jgi:hypothetical protein
LSALRAHHTAGVVALDGKTRKRPGFNKTTIDLICTRLIQGMSMSQACATPDVPSAASVYLKTARDGVASIIARARTAQQHALADKTQDLAETMTLENWQPVQAQIKAIQWRASKVNAPTYGDKHLVVGGDGEGPVGVKLALDYSRLAPHRLAQLLEIIKEAQLPDRPMIEAEPEENEASEP